MLFKSGKRLKINHVNLTDIILNYSSFSDKKTLESHIHSLISKYHETKQKIEEETRGYSEPIIDPFNSNVKPSRLLYKQYPFHKACRRGINQERNDRFAYDVQSKIKWLCHWIMNIIGWDRNHYYIMNIACTSSYLNQFFYKPQEISRLLNYMEKMGILQVSRFTMDGRNYYWFDPKHPGKGESQEYRINPVAIHAFLRQCKKEGIKMFKPKIKDTEYYKDLEKTIDINPDEVFVGNTHIVKPNNISVYAFEEQVIKTLYELNPETTKRMKIIEEMKFLGNDIKERYQYNLTWNKNKTVITSIAIRSTNQSCSLKKDNPDGKDRKDVKDDYKLNISYDVKGSVPRITYLMNKGSWMNESTDPYEEIWKEFCNLTNENFKWNKDIRKSVKQLFMPAYFDKFFISSVKRNAAITKKYLEEICDIEINETHNYYVKAANLFKQAMINVIGNPLGISVFQHESNIYIDVQNAIKATGSECWKIYDEFHWNTSSHIDIDVLIKYKALSYYKEIKGYNSKKESERGDKEVPLVKTQNDKIPPDGAQESGNMDAAYRNLSSRDYISHLADLALTLQECVDD